MLPPPFVSPPLLILRPALGQEGEACSGGDSGCGRSDAIREEDSGCAQDRRVGLREEGVQVRQEESKSSRARVVVIVATGEVREERMDQLY